MTESYLNQNEIQRLMNRRFRQGLRGTNDCYIWLRGLSSAFSKISEIKQPTKSIGYLKSILSIKQYLQDGYGVVISDYKKDYNKDRKTALNLRKAAEEILKPIWKFDLEDTNPKYLNAKKISDRLTVAAHCLRLAEFAYECEYDSVKLGFQTIPLSFIDEMPVKTINILKRI